MRRVVFIAIALLGGALGAIGASRTWHGPIVLSLSADHGVDTGDLIVFPIVALAIAAARGSAVARPGRGWAAPISAIALGALMLLAGVAEKAGGGPLVPSAGGTFDGAIRQAAAQAPVPVGRWSAVAATYDGGTLRLYVDGRQVSSAAVDGTIQSTPHPLWIGGNRPYGEHFAGLIDEVRVYERALTSEEVRRDIARPVAPAPGLVAGYSFDAGSAADVSGDGNTGEIRGAVRAAGRYGDALRFDGRAAVVRVPASQSLALRRAMTLSAWIRPSALQSGWRTVVQRETDAYLLTAGSARQDRTGAIDDLRAGLLACAAAWFCIVVATSRSPWSKARRRSWWLPVALFTVGSLADAALVPTGALLGSFLVALWLATTAASRVERVSFAIAATACIALTTGSIAGIASVERALAPHEGSAARTAALGGLFAIAGVSQLIAARRARSDVAAA